MRFQIILQRPQMVPAAEARRGHGSGGLKEHILGRVSFEAVDQCLNLRGPRVVRSGNVRHSGWVVKVQQEIVHLIAEEISTRLSAEQEVTYSLISLGVHDGDSADGNLQIFVPANIALDALSDSYNERERPNGVDTKRAEFPGRIPEPAEQDYSRRRNSTDAKPRWSGRDPEEHEETRHA